MEKMLQLIREETLKISQKIKNINIVRQLKLYEIIHSNIRQGIKKTKREIFYSSPKLFSNQRIVDQMIERFLKKFQLKITDLNIKASLKGLFIGKLEFIDNLKKYQLFKDLIPDMNEIKEINCNFQNILIIEKDSMMLFIKEVFNKFNKIPPFLLVTGKGYPDHNTIHFLQFLENQKKNIFGLFDLDPHGLNIFKTYKNKIKSMQRIGISSKDVFQYKVKKEELLPITERDKKLILSLKKDKEFGTLLKEDLDFLEGLSKKMEIEIFTSHDIEFIKNYLEERIKL